MFIIQAQCSCLSLQGYPVGNHPPPGAPYRGATGPYGPAPSAPYGGAPGGPYGAYGSPAHGAQYGHGLGAAPGGPYGSYGQPHAAYGQHNPAGDYRLCILPVGV